MAVMAYRATIALAATLAVGASMVAPGKRPQGGVTGCASGGAARADGGCSGCVDCLQSGPIHLSSPLACIALVMR